MAFPVSKRRADPLEERARVAEVAIRAGVKGDGADAGVTANS